MQDVKDVILYAVAGRDGDSEEWISSRGLFAALYLADWAAATEFGERAFKGVEWYKGKYAGPYSKEVVAGCNDLVADGLLDVKVHLPAHGDVEPLVRISSRFSESIRREDSLAGLDQSGREGLGLLWEFLGKRKQDELMRMAKSTYPLLFVRVFEKIDMLKMAADYVAQYQPRFRPGSANVRRYEFLWEPQEKKSTAETLKGILANPAGKLLRAFNRTGSGNLD